MSGQQQRTSLPSSLGDLWRRVQILEALVISGGGGLQFGGTGQVYGAQNKGEYLSVDTSSIRPAGDWDQGWSVAFRSTYTPSGDPGEQGGFLVLMENGTNINLIATGNPLDPSVQFFLSSDNDFEIDTGTTMALFVGTTLTLSAGDDVVIDQGGNVIMDNLPTSAAGLPSGALWNNLGLVNIV